LNANTLVRILKEVVNLLEGDLCLLIEMINQFLTNINPANCYISFIFDVNSLIMKKSRPNAYIYPITSRSGGIPNPYIRHCIDALEKDFNFLNRFKPSKTGIFDLVMYFSRIDVIFLNWPEEIPGRKGALFQVLFFILVVYYFKLRSVKIVWTLHNRASHYEVGRKLKSFINRFIARKADYIITHSQEGIVLANELSCNNAKKIVFIHHPVLPLKAGMSLKQKNYDLLIWGTIAPYKGVDSFLDFASKSDLKNYKILIAGKITKEWLKPGIYAHRSDKIEIIDDYISGEDLDSYIAQSRIILFTYAKTSILSSGALMDTLIHTPAIIGPDFGAFKELAEMGLIYTYRDFEHLNQLVPMVLSNQKNKAEKIRAFCESNTWPNFGRFIHKTLYPDH
jgi:beta-1,4-mannosyltransferase